MKAMTNGDDEDEKEEDEEEGGDGEEWWGEKIGRPNKNLTLEEAGFGKMVESHGDRKGEIDMNTLF